MVNYSKGKIYKVCCDETNKTYYGSTTMSLSRRMTCHRSTKGRVVFQEMISPKIYLVEDFPCERKEQLLQRERHFIENNDCINRNVPSRTTKEWKRDNREIVLSYQREYNLMYSEKVKEKLKENFTCECGSVTRIRDKSKHIKTKKHIKYVNSI